MGGFITGPASQGLAAEEMSFGMSAVNSPALLKGDQRPVSGGKG